MVCASKRMKSESTETKTPVFGKCAVDCRKDDTMQLCLEFQGDGLCLPLSYRQYVQAMIYHVLRQEDSYSTALHDGGEMYDGRRFKLFTFGQLEGQYAVQNRQIRFFDRVTLEIRSIRNDLLLRLLREFYVGRRIRLKDNLLTVVKCVLLNRRIFAREITIYTKSPIVAYITERDGKTTFFSPSEEMFYSLVVTNAHRKWQSFYGTADDLTITPVENAVWRKQVTQFKDTRITAWNGRFRLSGSEEMLNFLYHTGLGAKNSQGFGMFELLNAHNGKNLAPEKSASSKAES